MTESVVVAVRVRPMSAREEAAGASCIISMHENSVVVVDPTAFDAASALELGGGAKAARPGTAGTDLHEPSLDAAMWAKQFTFDGAFWSCDPTDSHFAEQEHVYRLVGVPLLQNAWRGYNCSLFAYGQTGAGKSYSMMGAAIPGAVSGPRDDTEAYGLIPRICCGLFEGIRQSREAELTEGGGGGARTQYTVEARPWSGASPGERGVGCGSGSSR